MAGIAAGALALAGLVIPGFAPAQAAAPPANTSTNPVATISPTTVPAGATQTFAVTFQGGTTNPSAAFRIQVPSGFLSPSLVSLTGTNPGQWTSGFDTATRVYTFVVDNNSHKLAATDYLTATIQAQAPASSGALTWPASWSGNTNLNSFLAITPSPVVTVGNLSQTISFDAPANRTFGDPDFTVSATGGGSGNPVTFSASGPCTSSGPNGATIHLTGAGSCTITANQTGGPGYTAAPAVAQTFSIAKANQTITLGSIPTQTYGDGPVTVSASSTSGLAVTLAATGACSLSGTSLTLTGAGSCTVAADQAGNTNYNAATQQSVTFTINKAGAVLAVSGVNKTYTGSPQGVAVTTTPSGVSGISVTYDGSATVPTDAGSYAVVATLDNPNYAATPVVGNTLVIAPKHLTGTFAVAGKTYDGSTAATVTDRSLVGAVGGDAVSLTGGSASFAVKDAGTQTATLTGAALSGAAAHNYVLDSVATTTGQIHQLQVTGTIVAADKEYDGTAQAEVLERSIIGKLGGDDLDLDVVSASFSDATVGSHTVTAGIALKGAAKDNYTLSSPTATAAANIFKKGLTGAFTVADRDYDTTTDATVTSCTLPTGVIGADVVTLDCSAATASFGSKDAGDRTATLGGAYGLTGTNAGNYSIASITQAHGTIRQLAVTGSIDAPDKVYDSTTEGTASGSVSGVLGGETVGVSVDDVLFDGAGVGSHTVSATIGLTGAAAVNYALVHTTASDSAAITPRHLTGSFTAHDKVYDGTDSAVVTNQTLDAVQGTDTITLDGGTAKFDSSNIGVHAVTLTGATLGGAKAGNYVLDSVSVGAAEITKRIVTGSFTAANKVFDGGRTATVEGSLTNTVEGDSVQLVVTDPTFDTRDAGVHKLVTGTLSLGGTAAGNYHLDLDASSDTAYANITPSGVIGSFTAKDKVYDGNANAEVQDTHLTGITNGDTVELLVGNPHFDDEHADTDKTVTGTLSLGGTDAGNYTLDEENSDTTATATISRRPVTGTFTAASKMYDGSRDTDVDPHLSNTVAGDDIALLVSDPMFDDRDAGIGKTVTGTLSLTGTALHDYVLAEDSVNTAQADITKRPVTGSFAAESKVYDGTAAATVHGSLANTVSGDSVNLVVDSAHFGTKDVGIDKTVTGQLSLGGSMAHNYTLDLPNSDNSATADITARHVGGSFTASSKVYDGDTAATISGRSLDAASGDTGAIGGDSVSLTGGAATFDTKEAQNGKTVAGTGFSLTGTDAENYTLDSSTLTTTADITKRTVGGSFAAGDKVYDGNTAATITGRSLDAASGDTGTIAEDAVHLSGGTATFATKDVGTGKTVTGTGFALAGTDADNYTLDSSTLTTTADVTKRTVGGSFAAGDKVYDGNTAATITGRDLDAASGDTGKISADTVSLSGGTASFADKKIGTDKSVTGTGFTLAGADAGNYTLADSTLHTTANVTALALIGSFTADDKVYDGTTTATVKSKSLSGILGDDSVELEVGNPEFGTKTAATGKTVTGLLSLSGDDAENYSLDPALSRDTASADITKRTVGGSFTAGSKVYDGTTDAEITGRSLDSAEGDFGKIGTDDVSLSGGSATFADKNAENGKSVTGTGFTLEGDDASNYSLASSTLTTSADISRRVLTGSITAVDKVYDSNTGGTATGSASGLLNGEHVDVVVTDPAFDEPGVGTHTVTATIGLSGDAAVNYELDSTTATDTADITPRHLTGTFLTHDKVYDGNDLAAITDLTLYGVQGTDSITLTGGTAKYSSREVGDRTVSLTGATLAGVKAGNYVLDGVAIGTAKITPLQVTGTITAANKVYDGNTDTTATGFVTGIPGDDLGLSATGAHFGTATAGTGKTVTAAIQLTGADKDNYALSSNIATDHADITPAPVVGSITAGDKTYDGGDGAEITGRNLTGVVAPDAVSLVGGTATFDDPDVANGKTVTATGLALDGADKDNYTLTSTTATATAVITARHLIGSFVAVDKKYDGTTAATITDRALDHLVAGDTVTLDGGAADFSVKDVGTWTVTLTGASLGGADKDNYVLDSVTPGHAEITAKALVGSFTAKNKVYDGTPDAEVDTTSLPGVLGTEDVTLHVAHPSFDDESVGNGKIVTATLSLTGTGADNYVLAPTSDSTTTADITSLGITGSITAHNKVYDGNSDATVDPSLAGVLAGDAVTVTAGNATFDDKFVGTDKTVTADLTLGGVDGGNYTVNATATDLADITKRHLHGSFTAHDKVYDGDANATITDRGLDSVVSGDTVTLAGGTASFAVKDAGTWTVTLGGATLGGADASNYALDGVGTGQAKIAPLEISGSITPQNKVYDGNPSATVTPSLSGVLGSDSVGVAPSDAHFDGKDVGSHQVSAELTLTGAHKDNYKLASTTAIGHADITVRHLTGSFTAHDKVYDGTTNATITDRALGNVVAGENVTLAGGTSAFGSRNVGTWSVTLIGATLGGTGKDNYVLDGVTNGSASIAQKPVTGSFTPDNKVWNGTDALTIHGLTLSGAIPADDVSLVGGPTHFPSSAVGMYSISGTGFGLTGADAANYLLTLPLAAKDASITPLYSGKGFYAPVDTAAPGATRIWNTIKGGQTVPLKFEVFNAAGTVEQTSVSIFGADATAQAKAFTATPVSCTTADATSDPIEVTTTGGTSLRYDTTAGQFIQNWKTPTTVGSCYTVTVKSVDGTTVGPAYFKITK